jgi:Transposase DDE domain group 1
MTECTQSSFGFEACGRREIAARFDGGTIGSDGGAFLLRQTGQRLNLLPRMAECFLDGANQERVEHTIQEMLAQRIKGWRWATKTSTIMSNCVPTRSSALWRSERN